MGVSCGCVCVRGLVVQGRAKIIYICDWNHWLFVSYSRCYDASIYNSIGRALKIRGTKKRSWLAWRPSCFRPAYYAPYAITNSWAYKRTMVHFSIYATLSLKLPITRVQSSLKLNKLIGQGNMPIAVGHTEQINRGSPTELKKFRTWCFIPKYPHGEYKTLPSRAFGRKRVLLVSVASFSAHI